VRIIRKKVLPNGMLVLTVSMQLPEPTCRLRSG
jgi:hypothetical protein